MVVQVSSGQYVNSADVCHWHRSHLEKNPSVGCAIHRAISENGNGNGNGDGNGVTTLSAEAEPQSPSSGPLVSREIPLAPEPPAPQRIGYSVGFDISKAAPIPAPKVGLRLMPRLGVIDTEP